MLFLMLCLLRTNVMFKSLRRFVHHNNYNPPTVLRYGDEIINSPPIVADALGSAFASHSREFSKVFYKIQELEGKIDFSVGNETMGIMTIPIISYLHLMNSSLLYLNVERGHWALMEF